MNEQDQSLANALLAASIHEIKNRFGLLFNSIDQLIDQLDISEEQQQTTDRIKSEAEFISNELVRVLASYKSLNNDCPVNIDQQILYDFLEDTWVRHGYTQKGNRVHIDYDCDPDLTGFFDEQVLTIILDTVIYNAIKAGAKRILLNADQLSDSDDLVITIEDDGPGFPDEMLATGFQPGKLSVTTNSTGLGLFFANKLIQSHAEGDKVGHIELGRANKLGGAQVAIHIPQ